MRKSMPDSVAPEGYEIGQTVRVQCPPHYRSGKIIEVTIRRFATNTYFQQMQKGELVIEFSPNAYMPFSWVIR
jgi:hypothetical protein